MKIPLLLVVWALLFSPDLEAASDQSTDSSSGSAGFTVISTVPPMPPLQGSGDGPRLPFLPVLSDPHGYLSENDWLACVIARRIMDFSLLALHPAAPAESDIKISARVDASQHTVHLEIALPKSSSLATNLRPDFAWDAHGYAPLAKAWLGTSPPQDDSAVTVPDELTRLQDLTGPNLAQADVAISDILQQHPACAAAHEQAALVLMALALRVNADTYSDSRRMLCRATAHLALAEALRGPVAPTWAGKIADAGIRALAGRELDALAHLDTLANAPDCPPSAKPWIDALCLRAKDDWRIVTPTAAAPLLVKIAYFATLQDNLSTLAGINRFAPLGNFTSVTDWGRAVLANPNGISVEAGNEFCQPTLVLEIAELDHVLSLEGVAFDMDHNLGAQLADPLVEQLYSGPKGALRVIGPDMFKDFARQNLLLELQRNYQWMKYALGLGDDAEKFRKDAWSKFQGMRLLETTYLFENEDGHVTPEQQAALDHVTWHPWEIASGDLPNGFIRREDQNEMLGFFQDGLPFGTVYAITRRPRTLELGTASHRATASPPPASEGKLVRDYIKTSAYAQAYPFPTDEIQETLMTPASPHIFMATYPPPPDLLALAPSSFPLFACGRSLADLIAQSRPWWDYNLGAIRRIERYKLLLDDATLEEVLQKHAALEPDVYFDLGDLLRAEGKTDAAAEADRKGFDEAYDQVGMSNRIGPLVDYYYEHGRKDEALLVAKRAADVYSECGLLIYFHLLEKLGRFTEAADCAHDIFTRYGNHSAQDQLYAAHPDIFHDQNEILVGDIFPNGLAKVDFSHFTGPPPAGCRITNDSEALEESGLLPNDVIVALDNYLVERARQFGYLSALKDDPHMEIIIWRKSRYMIAHTSAPKRDFGVKLEDFKPVPK